MRKKRKQTNPLLVFPKTIRSFLELPTPKNLSIIGFVFLITWGILTVHKATALSFSSTKPLSEASYTTSTDIPSQIAIPTLNIALPTFEASITNGIWQIHDNGVSHLSSSKNPGEDGNSIFYAHNTDDMFGKLHDINKGDMITVTTKDHNHYTYIVTDIRVVNPTDIDVLTEHSGETVTLYTCTGFADLKRLIVKAQKKTTISQAL